MNFTELSAAYFRGQHPKYRWYAHFKYKMDPCYVKVAEWIPPDSFTVDLGTGIGMLPTYLHCLGEGRSVLGVEWDDEKVAVAKSSTQMMPDVRIEQGDVRAFEIPKCDRITIIDLLHYYDRDVQISILKKCRVALNAGGKLLIRDGDGAKKNSARVTRVIEQLSTRFGWNKGPQVNFRSADEIAQDMKDLGFSVGILPTAAKTHPGNVLIVGSIAELRQ